MSLAHVAPSDLATSDPVGAVLAYCQQGQQALADARTLADARNVWAATKTLEAAVQARDIAGEAATAASALRVDAERRVGQLQADERAAGRLASRGRPLRAVNLDQPEVYNPPTLADFGISHDQAAEFARLAALDDETYEKAKAEIVEKAGETGLNVSRAGVLRAANPEAEKRPDERWIDANRWVTKAKNLATTVDPVLNAVRFGVFPGDQPDLVRQAVRDALTEAAGAVAAVLKEMDR